MQGLLAEFASAEGLLYAARQAVAAGYCDLDAYSPLPVAGLAEVITPGLRATAAPSVPRHTANGIRFSNGPPLFWDLPWLRPLPGWSLLLPPPLRYGLVGAMLATMVSGPIWAGSTRLRPLPRTDLPADALDHYFLCISASDPQFDPATTQDFLLSLHPQRLLEQSAAGAPSSSARH